MNSKHMRMVSSSLLALLVGVAASTAVAGPKPLPVNSNAFGQGYGELAAGWTEWVTAIPNATNPLFDDTGAYAAIGQSGKVWFLVGSQSSDAVTRSVTVPTGTALFFPIVNYFWVNTPEAGDAPWSPAQEAYARGVLAYFIDTAWNLVLEIDGVPYSKVDTLRVASTVGICTPPPAKEDNLFGVPLNPGPHECVADGYWALLPPLSVGEHTIRFAGEILAAEFSLDVTYHVTVRPRQKVGASVMKLHP
jgi:hypothetical protein